MSFLEGKSELEKKIFIKIMVLIKKYFNNDWHLDITECGNIAFKITDIYQLPRSFEFVVTQLQCNDINSNSHALVRVCC